MKKRLIEFLAYKNLGQNKFEEICGIANGTISNMRNNMTVKTAMKISAAFPELNICWLLIGEGKMLKEADVTISPAQLDITAHDELVSELKKRLEDKDEIIALQKEKINTQFVAARPKELTCVKR